MVSIRAVETREDLLPVSIIIDSIWPVWCLGEMVVQRKIVPEFIRALIHSSIG